MKPSTNPLIQFKNIKKAYKTGENVYEALKGITLTIFTGEFVAIMGPSGSGKSTTMHIMGALDTPTTGEYLLNGIDISKYTDDQLSEIRNKEIGFVFQSFNLLPRTSVIKNVERPMMYSPSIPSEKRHERAMEMLRLVHLEEKANNMSNHISGGQIQRVAVARALVMNPSLLLADEPTGNLDSKTSHEIMSFFQSLNKQGRTIVVITHEPDIAAYAKRIVTIKDGVIVSDRKNVKVMKGGM
ncbi:MAG TPA: ABC transporter ATP-binding protein [Candidatus Saccharimonadales bacterium]|nr:ABC transporter ATP-binding protein [Candidatus Saccharimonadales bacterium]